MIKKSSRKTQEDIIKNIFNALGVQSKNVNEIAKEINSYHSTVREYLELIEFIQQKAPRLILERTGHSYQASIVKKE